MRAAQAPTNKLFQYQALVEDRKMCNACTGLIPKMINPSSIESGKYDTDQIGPWTQWQGDLNAELMIVGQDWGGPTILSTRKEQRTTITSRMSI